MRKAIVAIAIALSPALAIAGPGVRFDTVLSESGKQVAAPSVWVGFGEQAVIEVPGKIRIIASAQAPAGAQSLVKAEIYRFVDGKWKQESAPSMEADLSKTPSFEQTLRGSPYRVVIMPRAAVQPSSHGS